MSTRNLIDAIASGSALDIESAFEDTMAEKVSVQIEAKRLQIAQTMFTTEEVELDELTEEELAEWSELLEGDLTIRTLYKKYASAYVGGERSHKPAEKAITKVHGKKVMGHLRKAADANADGDMDREDKHFERARDAAGDSERLGSSVGRNRSAFRKQFEEVDLDEGTITFDSEDEAKAMAHRLHHNNSSGHYDGNYHHGVKNRTGGKKYEIEHAYYSNHTVNKEIKKLQNMKEESELDEEQLNELGPETTVSYINKATKDAHATIAAANAGGDKDSLSKRLEKRKSGLTKAMTKIVRKAKEEQEEQE